MIPATVYSNPFARTLTRLRLSPVLMMSIRYLVCIQISRATAYSGEVFNGIASNDSRISEPAIRLFPDQTDRRLFGLLPRRSSGSSRGAGRRRSTPSTLFTVSITTGFLPGDRLFSRGGPATPASAYRRCQRHTAGRLSPERPATWSTGKPSAESRCGRGAYASPAGFGH